MAKILILHRSLGMRGLFAIVRYLLVLSYSALRIKRTNLGQNTKKIYTNTPETQSRSE